MNKKQKIVLFFLCRFHLLVFVFCFVFVCFVKQSLSVALAVLELFIDQTDFELRLLFLGCWD